MTLEALGLTATCERVLSMRSTQINIVMPYAMKTRHGITCAVVALLVVMLVCVMPPIRPIVTRSLLSPAPSDDELYPRPSELPQPTNRPLAELLAEYESAIQSLSPEAHETLQPGLSVEELDRLEDEYSIVLSADMRALYSWKNGSDPEKHIDVFPYMRFVPLAEALAARDSFRNSAKDKAVYDEWLGHRYSWVIVIEDAAGDGYFYDPDRREEASCFFYKSHDDVAYMFYPAIGNYIEQLLELHRTQQLAADERGLTLNVDRTYDQEKAFLNQFGQWME